MGRYWQVSSQLSSVQSSPSSQTPGSPWQKLSQVSLIVQGSPSSHAVTALMTWWQPVSLSHTSRVHSSPSSQGSRMPWQPVAAQTSPVHRLPSSHTASPVPITAHPGDRTAAHNEPGVGVPVATYNTLSTSAAPLAMGGRSAVPSPQLPGVPSVTWVAQTPSVATTRRRWAQPNRPAISASVGPVTVAQELTPSSSGAAWYRAFPGPVTKIRPSNTVARGSPTGFGRACWPTRAPSSPPPSSSARHTSLTGPSSSRPPRRYAYPPAATVAAPETGTSSGSPASQG